MKLFMTKEEREEKIAYHTKRREQFRKEAKEHGEFAKLLREEKKENKKEGSMFHVYLDLVLALFCFATIILAPLGLFFAMTAWMKYKATK